MIHEFQKYKSWSQGQRRADDLTTILAMIDGCVKVETSTIDLDRSGIDYVATLRRGARIYIDAKNRQKGCSRYWKGEPDLSLEIWSVMPAGKYNMPNYRAVTGWTLCERKDVDLILFKYDPSDCTKVFLVSYQLLRMAFRRNLEHWREVYHGDIQDSGKWQSQCVFVPVSAVFKAIEKVSVHETVRV